MRKLGFLAVVAVSLAGVSLASAQEVQVQGQGTVSIGQPPPQQPPVYQQAPPPPGYGQYQQQPVYGQQPVYQPQPVYQQPQPYYVQPQPQQPRYVDREESMAPLWISGVILLPVSFVLTGLAATSGGGPVDYILFNWIPLVGPWFAIGQDFVSDEEIAGSVLGGLAQATGLVLIILGIAIRRTVRVATYALGDGERAPELTFNVAGGPTSAQLGLTLSHF
jgi:hypothetical protein